MADVTRALLIAATLLLLDLPSRFGGTTFAFAVATALMFAVNALLLGTFPSAPRVGGGGAVRPSFLTSGSFITAAIVAALLASAARAWLHEILIYPHDPWRADMLVVIQDGIRRLLHGQNPYTIYRLPWEATLPYGPLMWLPYSVPLLLRADVRFLSLTGEMFIPVACSLAAVAAASRRRYLEAAGCTIMLAAVAVSPDVRNFSSIAHTPSYWPGLALFAWLAARERWRTAALLCGLLIVARTTIVAIAPVLLIAVWYRDRSHFLHAAAWLAIGVVVPYLPFAIWDARALQYALYGSYQVMMKGFVWSSTTWVQNTVGVTGLLLRANLKSTVEAVQGVVMICVLIVAWRSIRRGAPPLPWMAFALFAFSATTLWPVHYVYFDVVMLWIASALSQASWIDANGVALSWTATAAAASAAVLAIAFADLPRDPTLDVGIGATRPLLYKGFSTDEGQGGDRTFSWIDGTTAEMLVDRRSRRDADIELVVQPHLPNPAATQDISVALNGVVLGTRSLSPGWQTVSFPAPTRSWRIGVNELTLSFSTAASPQETHTGDDSRKLSAAIDRLTVRTRL